VVVAATALTGLMRYENSAWIRGTTASLFPGPLNPPGQRAMWRAPAQLGGPSRRAVKRGGG